MNLGSVNIQSDNSINPYSIVAGLNASNTKGFVVNFDNPDNNLIQSANNNTSGTTRIKASSLLNSNKHIQLEYGGDDYVRSSGVAVTGNDFYKNRGILSIGRNSGGMIINISPTGNTGNLWFEQNGNSIMYLKGGPSPSDGSLGLALNPDGTETPSANLQVGGTGTTGTFKYVDGNESNGYVLTSDNDGNATWQPSSGGGSVFTGGTVNGPTNFTNGLTANTISATTYYNLPGSSSGNCFVDFYVRNVHGCSPISIWDETQTRASNAYGELSFALGDMTETWGDYSYANGVRTRTGSDNGYLVNSCTAGVCILDSSYGDTTADYTTGSTAFVVFDDMDYSANYSTYVVSVSAVTCNGTNTIIYLNDLFLDTFGQPGVITNTYTPNLWLGNQVFGGKYAKANGSGSIAIGGGSSAEGESSYSVGNFSSARNTSIAYGPYSSSEGKNTYAYGVGSHSEGQSTNAIGTASHAEGAYSTASGEYSHSEGSSTASGIFSHAEGDSSVASGQYAHSQNKGTQAIGGSTHAGGFGGIARGEVSFSHGLLTEANGSVTAVLGGDLNIISSGNTYGSAILGGSGNTITYLSLTDDVTISAIIGGSGNTVTSFESAIIGGEFNNVTAPRSVILGGANITANASDTTYVPNFVITESYTPTSSADTAGEPGSITWDNTYLYYKTNTGWRRINGSTF
jgi:hypothetical protein